MHGRTWVELPVDVARVNDVIVIDGHAYVPFAPFPAIVLMPLVALLGPEAADRIQPAVNAILAASVVSLAWWTTGQVRVLHIRDRFALTMLLGLGTQIWWVTTRGGVWHTGHLVATILVLTLLAEMFGRRRPLLLGLLVGASFLTRAPLVFAGPVMAVWVVDAWPMRLEPGRRLAEWWGAIPWAAWGWLLLVGFAPAFAFFLWYNVARFGSPLESGYALASLPSGWSASAPRACSRLSICR